MARSACGCWPLWSGSGCSPQWRYLSAEAILEQPPDGGVDLPLKEDVYIWRYIVPDWWKELLWYSSSHSVPYAWVRLRATCSTTMLSALGAWLQVTCGPQYCPSMSGMPCESSCVHTCPSLLPPAIWFSCVPWAEGSISAVWSCPLIPAVGQPFSAHPPPLAKVTCSGQTSPIRQPRHGYSPSRGRAREAGSSSFPSGADSLASDQTLLTNKM